MPSIYRSETDCSERTRVQAAEADTVEMTEKNGARQNVGEITRKPFPAWRLPDGVVKATDAELDSASVSCGIWEWGCAAAVVLAVIAEFVIAFIHPPYDSGLNEWGTLISDAAIAMGIVGEVIFGRLDARIQTELRSRSDKRLARATEVAAEANAQAAEAQRETAKLNVAVEEQRKQNLELEQALAPRFLEFMAPVEALKKFAGTKVMVGAVDEIESQRLAWTIREILKAADWDVSHIPAPGKFHDGVEVGYVWFSPTDKAPTFTGLSLQGQRAAEL